MPWQHKREAVAIPPAVEVPVGLLLSLSELQEGLERPELSRATEC